MNNDTNKLIPELRFPEFFETDEWKVEELGDISEIVRGGSPRPIQDYQTKDVDGLNWLKIADVSSESKYITETKEKVIKEALSSTREVNPGDLILSNSMSFGRPYILKITTCIHDGWIAIRKISPNTFENYLYYLISSESSQNYFQINAAGAAVKNLNAEIIKLLPITFPNLTEQQKIADCLSSLDELITAHTNKLETLKTYKKGLMQNLFPQEGEKVPKLRFKEFEKDGEWIEKRLDEICDINPSIKQLPSEFIYIDLESVDNGILTPKSKITLDLAPSRAQRLLKKEDVIYQMVRPYQMNNYFFEIDSDIEYVASTGYAQLRAFVSSKFLFQLIHTQNFVDKVLTKCTGSNYPAINSSDLKSIKSQIPTEKEQQKIAETLSSLDNLIKEQSNKIEQLKSHKKGLMQGLFPKVNN